MKPEARQKALDTKAARAALPRPFCGFCGEQTVQNDGEQKRGKFWCPKCSEYPATIFGFTDGMLAEGISLARCHRTLARPPKRLLRQDYTTTQGL